MIKANINRENQVQEISAKGAVLELMTDVAVLIGGIYTQLHNADPTTAAIFKHGIANMANDPTGPMWQALGNQTGIVFRQPGQDD